MWYGGGKCVIYCRVCSILTGVWYQAQSRPQQQEHSGAASLDELYGTRMSYAMSGLPIYLHYLISNLRGHTHTHTHTHTSINMQQE